MVGHHHLAKWVGLLPVSAHKTAETHFIPVRERTLHVLASSFSVFLELSTSYSMGDFARDMTAGALAGCLRLIQKMMAEGFGHPAMCDKTVHSKASRAAVHAGMLLSMHILAEIRMADGDVNAAQVEKWRRLDELVVILLHDFCRYEGPRTKAAYHYITELMTLCTPHLALADARKHRGVASQNDASSQEWGTFFDNAVDIIFPDQFNIVIPERKYYANLLSGIKSFVFENVPLPPQQPTPASLGQLLVDAIGANFLGPAPGFIARGELQPLLYQSVHWQRLFRPHGLFSSPALSTMLPIMAPSTLFEEYPALPPAVPKFDDGALPPAVPKFDDGALPPMAESSSPVLEAAAAPPTDAAGQEDMDVSPLNSLESLDIQVGQINSADVEECRALLNHQEYK